MKSETTWMRHHEFWKGSEEIDTNSVNLTVWMQNFLNDFSETKSRFKNLTLLCFY